MGWLIATILKPFLGSLFKYLEAKANNETERQRIEALRDQHGMTTSAQVVTTGMQFKWFWVPWLTATMPLAGWFGWGMLDTAFNGALPDVAEIPPGLLPWAQIAWQNLFYSGAGVAGAQLLASAFRR